MNKLDSLNPLLLRMNFAYAPTSVLLLQLLVFFVSLFSYAYLWRKYPTVWGRPAFFFALAFIFFYQIPSILYGSNLLIGLESAASFLIVVNLVPGIVLLWLWWTEAKSKNVCLKGACTSVDDQPIVLWVVVLSSVIVAIFGYFFYVIPWACSGLWALLFDPESTLLARELAMKLNNSPFANRLYGTYVNVVGPIVCFFGIFCLIKAVKSGRYLQGLLWAAWCVISILLLLVSGVKGALLSMGVAILIAVISIPGSYYFRALTFVSCAVLIVGTVFSFQWIQGSVKRDQKTSYDVGVCAKQFGSCVEAAELIKSASLREAGGLGLTREQLKVRGERLENVCGIKIDFPSLDMLLEKEEELGKLSPLKILAKADSILDGLIVRAFQVPFQVAAWHFMYADEHESPGWRVVSAVSRVYGNYINLAEEVYKEYGFVYSGGDRTSTSTAPTSFLFLYYSGLSWLGLAFSLVLLFALDTVAVKLCRNMPPPFLYIAYGLFATMALNLISSDFFTVIFSHGGLAAIVLLWVIKRVSKS